MPIFDFHCPGCGHEFEELVFKRDEPVNCPKCGSHTTRKMSAFAAFSGGRSASPGGCTPGGGCAPGGG